MDTRYLDAIPPFLRPDIHILSPLPIRDHKETSDLLDKMNNHSLLIDRPRFRKPALTRLTSKVPDVGMTEASR